MLDFFSRPQVLRKRVYSLRDAYHKTLQIKNIKLHIVTDIKVTINSLSIFGFRYLVGGRVFLLQNKKRQSFSARKVFSRRIITGRKQHTYLTGKHI